MGKSTRDRARRRESSFVPIRWREKDDSGKGNRDRERVCPSVLGVKIGSPSAFGDADGCRAVSGLYFRPRAGICYNPFYK